VAENAEAVVESIRLFRASVLRAADELRSGGGNLVAFPGGSRD
jgi:hypothetical protein